MKRSEIERRLKNASDGFTPNVLPKIMENRHNPVFEKYPFNKREKTIGLQKKKLMVAMACLLIVALGMGIFLGVMNQENETVYMEINPSLKVTTNRFDRIKEIEYLNADAEQLFDSHNLKNMKLDNAVELFVDLSYEKGYMDEEYQINIFVDSPDEEKAVKTAQRLQNNAKQKAREKNVEPNVNASKVTKEEIEKAKNNDIPIEKIIVIRQIMEIDDSWNEEELQEKRVNELRAILREYKQENNNSEQDNGHENPGQGPPNQNDEGDKPGQGNGQDNPGQDNPGQSNGQDNNQGNGQDNNQGNGQDNPGQSNEQDNNQGNGQDNNQGNGQDNPGQGNGQDNNQGNGQDNNQGNPNRN